VIERLYPDPAEVEITEQLALFEPWDLANPRRPYLFTNFVTSVDGHATLEGRSGKLAGEADLQMLLGLRERADAVMVGAGTLRNERYGRIIASEETRWVSSFRSGSRCRGTFPCSRVARARW
jgi:hypothetical protein